MKKTYQKPRILFEKMELNNTISSCDFMIVKECVDLNPDNSDPDEVPYKVIDTTFGGTTVMVTRDFFGTVCNGTEECYHVPSDRVATSLS